MNTHIPLLRDRWLALLLLAVLVTLLIASSSSAVRRILPKHLPDAMVSSASDTAFMSSDHAWHIVRSTSFSSHKSWGQV